MTIQIYAHKRGFDTQKAERFFKERRIAYQWVDLARHAPGARELQTIAASVGGAKALIDTASAAYQAHYIGHIEDESAIIEALIAHPKMLMTPIVRSGRRATLGYRPEVWLTWLEEKAGK